MGASDEKKPGPTSRAQLMTTIALGIVSALVSVFVTLAYVRQRGSSSIPAQKLIVSQGCPLPPDPFQWLKDVEEKEAAANLPTLKEVWDNHVGYISVKWANYLPAYEEEFQRIRAKKKSVVLLEIGVGTGGSLQIWRKFFGPESQIIGLDINPKTCTDLFYEKGITVHCMDVRNTAAVLKLFELYQFDIVIDDAGHASAALVTSFKSFWPKIAPGGVFAMEDIGGVYGSDGYQKKKDGYMEFMKTFADMTNLHMILWALKGMPQEITEFEKEVGQWIDSIRFQENLIIIRKLPASKANTFDVMQAGRNLTGAAPGDVPNYFNNVLRYQPMLMRDIGFNQVI